MKGEHCDDKEEEYNEPILIGELCDDFFHCILIYKKKIFFNGCLENNGD
jgi:hypothetical protein